MDKNARSKTGIFSLTGSILFIIQKLRILDMGFGRIVGRQIFAASLALTKEIFCLKADQDHGVKNRPSDYAGYMVLLLSLALAACTEMKFAESPHPYDPQLPDYPDINVAFVLGGGGAKGIAHVGVMEELIKQGITPDLIVGCSAGAIVGALYADSMDMDKVKQLILPQMRENLVNLSLNFLPFGISDGYGLQIFLKSNLKAQHFEELKIPFVAVATNLQFGDMTAFGKGELIPAVRASAAFPGIFTPVSIEGQFFIDGGVANNVPAEVARHMGAKFIIVIELDAGLPEIAPTNAFGILRRCLQISLRHQSRLALAGADYVIKIALPQVGTFEDGLNEVVYQRGREVGQHEGMKIRHVLNQKIRKTRQSLRN